MRAAGDMHRCDEMPRRHQPAKHVLQKKTCVLKLRTSNPPVEKLVRERRRYQLHFRALPHVWDDLFQRVPHALGSLLLQSLPGCASGRRNARAEGKAEVNREPRFARRTVFTIVMRLSLAFVFISRKIRRYRNSACNRGERGRRKMPPAIMSTGLKCCCSSYMADVNLPISSITSSGVIASPK